MLIVYWLHFKFLVTNYFYAIVIGMLCVICLLTIWLITFYKTQKKICIHMLVKLMISLFLCSWVAIYLYGLGIQSEKEKQMCIVSIDRYYTRRLDGIIFSFKGKKFDRKYPIEKFRSQYGETLLDSCKLHLTLTEIMPDIYYINKLHIAHESRLQND